MSATTHGRARADSDPLSRVLKPASGESPQERQARLEQEAEAKRISDAIDEQLRREKVEKTKARKEIRVLLLGQSESGKSTTLKQFQLLYAPSSFAIEAPSWRPIIYLNLVRSIRRILEIITIAEIDYNAYDDQPLSPVSPTIGTPERARRPTLNLGITDEELAAFASIRAALSPLLDLEDRLIALLSDPEEDSGEATHLNTSAFRTTAGGAGRGKEVALGGGWKRALGKWSGKNGSRHGHGSAENDEVDWTTDPRDPIHVLQRCATDMEILWEDERVQDILRKRRARMEENPGFYLNDIRRIVSSTYIPSIDDVLKARLKTLGVVEHRFSPTAGGTLGGNRFSKGTGQGEVDWLIYDVGGARNQRHVWAPFFDDVQALIFLAPISAFDQVLTEDTLVNRMEDSMLLWRNIVSNKLLRNVNLVLFLNKCDLLQKKLQSGIQLKTYMTSYGDRPNDFESIGRYFQSKFAAMHQTMTPNPERELYIHLTSVIDTRATEKIINSVREMILKDSLKRTKLL
ncbi:hypothetical protein M408DRAFT_169642 [Serendipita vermifera MAFF 305830]|uniref:G-alpha-domain-containing protein n=1 Tax=Serendipita vermifera MAFF 305830 TaxID=933852 RepID=A0A0C3B7E7_SERVB|nr:hypothetical protein M408DRAFT_169642 [Serendipita vermifera MAFF 305830]